MTSNETDRDRGAVAVLTALAMIPIAVALAVTVDSGRAWMARHSLQNGVEAAATSSAQTWMTGGTSCSGASVAIVVAT